jgi:hypothetical protein
MCFVWRSIKINNFLNVFRRFWLVNKYIKKNLKKIKHHALLEWFEAYLGL